MTLQGWTIETSDAPWSVVADGDVVVASGFCELAALVGRLPEEAAVSSGAGSEAVEQLMKAYLAGDLAALDRVEVRQPGGEFHQAAWAAMRQIPPGQTWSYAELASKAGRPAATRAAGTACAHNLVAPFVPCHRVVRSDGSLGGYEYGLHVKRWLLAHEEASAQASSAG